MAEAAAFWVAYLLSLLFLTWFLFQKRSRQHLPPGPQGSYLYGVKNQLPPAEPWKTYAKWSETYRSPIISFRVYNRTIVVLNDIESIHTLLDQRAQIYSERPMSWMYNVICGRGKSVFNIPASNPRHRIYRRMLQAGLGQRATKEAWDILREEAEVLVAGLAKQPEDWIQHIRRNAAGVIMKVAFGYSIASPEDLFIKVAEETSKISGWAMAPGRWLVDYYPIMRHIPSFIPGTQWKRQGLAWRERLNYLSEVPHNWVKQQMKKNNTYPKSFTSRFLQSHLDDEDGSVFSKLKSHQGGEDEDIVKWCAGGLYAGAADTTVSALTSFVLLMALYPEVQRKAGQEIDIVLGIEDGSVDSSRFSSPISDMEQLGALGYLQAVMKEVLRYAPVGNLALPHATLYEDQYQGYTIPKGASVIPNVWAVMHDPKMYHEPFAFRPERFTNEGSAEPDPRQFAYGFGRRSCPGSHFAETSMLLSMANILTFYSITPQESSLMEKTRGLEFTTGITSNIRPFPVRITPRRAASYAPPA
ncbi:hypothetical protein NLJ89_g6580 [Agrocybe chaxingu]|uniref:Cytochrome P450 n=1 Tax=Agrocybe chaxingu TaxID=84603 RepID=A0A9W8K5A1_9AGAR|nr:hypothetical protein NLJ89_g6580 [Agrocybe chaxingu]